MNDVNRPLVDHVAVQAKLTFLATFDWTKTPLGPIALWPPLLRLAADIMQESPSPIVILWGPDGHLVYNAAYARIAGARHPGILGQKTMEAWPEAAALNQRVLDACWAGEALSVRAEHLVLRRHGYPEDVWLDVDYSPILQPDGRVAGVWAIVAEVTGRVLAERRRVEAESQLALAIEAADLATWDYDLQNGTYSWSAKLETMFGLAPGTAKSREDFQRHIHPDDRALQSQAFERAFDPAGDGRYHVEFRVIQETGGAARWISTMGRAYFDESGRVVRAAGTALDSTARKNAERRQACLVELGDRLRSAETTAAIAQIAAEIAGTILNASRAGYAMIENETAFVEADWTNGESVSLVGPRLFGALGDPFCDPLRAGQIVVIEDVTTHPTTRDNAAPFLAIRMRALINVPLLENGVISAVFYVHEASVRQWDIAEVQLMRDIGDRTWEAFCRARTTERLRRLNETLESQVALRTAQRDRMWRLSSDVMLVTDFDGRIESANPAWKSLFGLSEPELAGRNLAEITHPEDARATMAAFRRCVGQTMPAKFESRHPCRGGNYLWLAWRAVAGDTSIHAVGRDITAEREQAEALQAAEAALRQAQKMEAVGQLTGGIAHDFNNLLQGITGALDLADMRLEQGRFPDVARLIAAARGSATRASALTHRLLAFSRRQPLDPKPVRANPLIGSMDELLRRTMGEHIDITLTLAPDLWPTMCDPNQLESAILNLAINARDAMPEGGRLIIETCNTHLSDVETAGRPELRSGAYICVAVTDTGTGMPASVIAQAFDPFYTTKPLGQGTGLGLSMIYGFIRQSEGDARIESEVGRGTTVKLYLPRFTGEADEAASAPTAPDYAEPARHASVLVVEDEAIVRSLVLEVLHDLGLSATEADSGQVGLEILQSKQPFDLLITDIGLPGLNGRQLAEAAKLLRPALKILFMTGYAEIAATTGVTMDPGMAMITKPFALSALAEKVREMIERE